MPELSRAQVVVYGAIAVALLLVGARAIRGEGGAESSLRGRLVRRRIESSSGGGFTVSGQAGDLVVDVTGAVRPARRLPAAGRQPGQRRRRAGRRRDRQGGAGSGQPRRAAGRRPAGGGARAGPGRRLAAPPARQAEEGPISLGTATVEQLDTIDGIGPVTAEDIIDFRDEHGGLSSVDQLDQVSGIGPATMESLRARLQP